MEVSCESEIPLLPLIASNYARNRRHHSDPVLPEQKSEGLSRNRPMTYWQHRGKTSTHAPGWAFPVSISVTLSSQIKVSRALSASFCAACGSVVLLYAARVFDYFVVIEIAFVDNQAQITETISRLVSEKVRW